VIDVRDLYFLTHLQGNAYLIYSLEWSQKIDKEDYIDWQYLLDNKLIDKQEIETIKRFSSIESGILFGLCHQSAGSSSGEWLDEIKLSKACKSRALIMCQEIKKELHITQGEAKK